MANLINEFTGNATPLDLRPRKMGSLRQEVRLHCKSGAGTRLSQFHRCPRRYPQNRRVWTKANQEVVAASIARHRKLLAQAGDRS